MRISASNSDFVVCVLNILGIENIGGRINIGSEATLSTYNMPPRTRNLSVTKQWIKFWDIKSAGRRSGKNGISVTERTTKLHCARKNAIFAGGVPRCYCLDVKA